jgi:hypothetical protein
MSDWTKVLLTNVALATAVVVVLFDAPPVSAGLGALATGVALWLREKRVRRRRDR